ncbi:MAG: molybdopterin oxidoreductase, partial [Bacteroidales bacterium]|nr:molybdopterin oxidoreductase [Bacteroidales bacterium]
MDEKIKNDLAGINAERGKIVLLSSTVISPSTIKLINEFGAQCSNFSWIQYDPISFSAILEANQKCFGKAVIPDYHFQNADLVVSFNADFLGTWLAPVHFIPGYTSRRVPGHGQKEMNRHIHFESGMSLTGSNADVRIKIKPSEEKVILAELYNSIAGKLNSATYGQSACRLDMSELADKLIEAGGRSILISGTNDQDIQIIVNGINSLLGNYSECIDLDNHLKLTSGIDSEIEKLVDDLNSGNVSALLMYNINPLYDYPHPDKLLAGIKKTELTINMTVSRNETAGMLKFECPVNHYLESWDDAEVMPGLLSLSQPCINPLFNTRSFQDSLMKWSGKTGSYHDYLKEQWEKEYFPFSGQAAFVNFWNDCLGKGIMNIRSEGKGTIQFNKTVLEEALRSDTGMNHEGYEVILSESLAIGTGRHANNPWLMELPDPVSRICWDNYASISPADAEKMGIKSNQIIKISEKLSIPAFIQPGQAEGTVSIALGYGHTGSGPVADNVGVNVYPFIQ